MVRTRGVRSVKRGARVELAGAPVCGRCGRKVLVTYKGRCDECSDGGSVSKRLGDLERMIGKCDSALKEAWRRAGERESVALAEAGRALELARKRVERAGQMRKVEEALLVVARDWTLDGGGGGGGERSLREVLGGDRELLEMAGGGRVTGRADALVRLEGVLEEL